MNKADVIPAISRLLKTRDGEIMLDYLRSRYYDCTMKPEELERQVGRRDVVLDLLRMKKTEKVNE